MRARTLVIMAIGLMAPSIAQAQYLPHDQKNFALFLLLCENHQTCERELAAEAADVAASTQSLKLDRRACIPPGTTDKTSADVVMDWYGRHRATGWLPYWYVIQSAVIEKWPCPPDPPRPPGPAKFEELGCRKGVCGAVRPDGTIDPRP